MIDKRLAAIEDGAEVTGSKLLSGGLRSKVNPQVGGLCPSPARISNMQKKRWYYVGPALSCAKTWLRASPLVSAPFRGCHRPQYSGYR